MILPTGSNPGRSSKPQRSAAFTLIELILVMALLLIVLGVSSPQLQRFFRGRNIDSEARRFLSLTVYGQSRAVSEGVPMILWLDTRRGTYGLRAAAGFMDPDDKALEYELDPNLHFELPLGATANKLVPITPDRVTGNLPSIRFGPDGFISQSSPGEILLVQGEKGDSEIIAVVQSTNRLRYELQSLNHLRAR
jgi:prepilin-type N-terminal cleavage/methylation domain-containing protein